MIRWMARVLPPPWVLGLFGAVYGIVLVVEYSLQVPAASHGDNPTTARGILVMLACGAFGVFRAVSLHPAGRPKYREWLCTAPWTSDSQLPAGPVHLVWQDLLVVAALSALAWGVPDVHPTHYGALFLCAYIVVLSAFNACTGGLREAYIVAFGLGLSARLDAYDYAALVVFLCLYVVALIGWKRSWAQFPWETPWIRRLTDELSSIRAGSQQDASRSTSNALGYPYYILAPISGKPTIPARHAVFLSLLAAWTAHVIMQRVNPGDKDLMATSFFFIVPAIAVYVRLMIYCALLWPPISLFGRIATGRLIIPEYDYVLLTPLATLACSLSIGWGLPRMGVPIEYSAPAAVFAALLISLGAGPTLGYWRLMGRHRTIAAAAGHDPTWG